MEGLHCELNAALSASIVLSGRIVGESIVEVARLGPANRSRSPALEGQHQRHRARESES